MANPWSSAATADEAAKGAGLDGFAVASESEPLSFGSPYSWQYQYMEGIAEANGGAGAGVLTIRKGIYAGDGDISGDYNTYAHSWTMDVDGVQVSCSGNEEGKTSKALWVKGDNAYSMLVRGQGDEANSFGLDEADVKLLVNTTK